MDTKAEAGPSSARVNGKTYEDPVLVAPDMRERYVRWAMGNRAALELLYLFCDMMQIPDDFVDADKPSDKAQRSALMTRLMHVVLHMLPENQLYKANAQYFAPVQTTVLVLWNIMNRWEDDEDESKRIYAYTYRNLAVQFFTLTAYLVGGWSHAVQVTEEVMDIMIQGESFKEWDNAAK